MTGRKILPNLRALRGHACRYADLPLMTKPKGVECPEHDGDISQLHELADRIFTAAEDSPKQPTPLMDGLIERAAKTATLSQHNAMPPLNDSDWPDPVGYMLMTWPARIVAREVD